LGIGFVVIILLAGYAKGKLPISFYKNPIKSVLASIPPSSWNVTLRISKNISFSDKIKIEWSIKPKLSSLDIDQLESLLSAMKIRQQEVLPSMIKSVKRELKRKLESEKLTKLVQECSPTYPYAIGKQIVELLYK